MLIFYLTSLIFITGTACFSFICWVLISHKQLFDMLFGWQAMLAKLYASDSKFKEGLGKILGNCEICFSHFITFLCFWVYRTFCIHVLHYWLTNDITVNKWHDWLIVGLINAGWYCMYGSISTIVSLKVINKLFNQ